MASKPKLSEHDWIEYEVVTGWSAVQQVLSRLAMEQCGGASLTCGSVSSSAAHVLYTYRCAFCAKQGCKWQARVRIPREGAMLAVKPEQRSLVHAEHKSKTVSAAMLISTQWEVFGHWRARTHLRDCLEAQLSLTTPRFCALGGT